MILFFLLLPDQVTQPLRKNLGPPRPVAQHRAKARDLFPSRVNGKLKTLDEAQTEVTKLHEQVAELTLRNQLLAAYRPPKMPASAKCSAFAMPPNITSAPVA